MILPFQEKKEKHNRGMITCCPYLFTVWQLHSFIFLNKLEEFGVITQRRSKRSQTFKEY